MHHSEYCLVLTNFPDERTARACAQQLVEAQLAACVQQLSPSKSVYRWQNKVEQAIEFPLLIKTSQARYAQVEAAILAQHPYELPEIICLPIIGGNAAYLQWLAA